MRPATLPTLIGGVLATLALLVAGTASASAATVTGGNADWGVKASFNEYVEHGPGMGTITASRGATRNADGTFDFQPGSGTYSPANEKVNATFGGRVYYEGHGGILKVTLTDPRISYKGDSGVLYADAVASVPFGPDAGTEHKYPNVDLATLDLSGVTPVDDGSKLTVAGIPATLTEAGVPVFGEIYPAGTALDPVSFELTYGASDRSGTVTNGKEKVKVGSKGAKVTLGKLGCDSDSCTVKAPKRITAKIKGGEGGKVKVAVKAPSTLGEGEHGKVVAKVSKRVARDLAAGRSMKLTADVTLKGDGAPVRRTLVVKAVPK